MAAILNGEIGVNARLLAIQATVKENAAARIHLHKTAGKTAQVWVKLRKQSGATQEKNSSVKVDHLC